MRARATAHVSQLAPSQPRTAACMDLSHASSGLKRDYAAVKASDALRGFDVRPLARAEA